MLREKKLQQLSLASLMIIREVIKKKNLTEAAREMGISQPAVSQQLARFEQIIGYPVIVRRGNNLILKDDAAAVALDQVALGMEALIRATQAAGQNGLKPRLGISPFAFEKIITSPKIFDNLIESFEIFVEPSDVLRVMLHDIDLDIVFRAVAKSEKDTDLLYESKLHWVSSANNPLKNSRLNDNLKIILGPERSIISKQVEAHLQRENIPFTSVMRLSTCSLCLKVVSTGVGFTVVPSFMKSKILGSAGNATELEFDTTLPDVPNIDYGLFYHKKVISYNDAFSVFEMISEALDREV